GAGICGSIVATARIDGVADGRAARGEPEQERSKPHRKSISCARERDAAIWWWGRAIHYRARVSFDVVVAADLEWGIGKANALPWPKLKGDMAHFRRVTSTAAAGKL